MAQGVAKSSSRTLVTTGDEVVAPFSYRLRLSGLLVAHTSELIYCTPLPAAMGMLVELGPKSRPKAVGLLTLSVHACADTR